jgi:hypothetical protein
VPQLKKIVVTRDVTFNEELFFGPATERNTIPIQDYQPVIGHDKLTMSELSTCILCHEEGEKRLSANREDEQTDKWA